MRMNAAGPVMALPIAGKPLGEACREVATAIVDDYGAGHPEEGDKQSLVRESQRLKLKAVQSSLEFNPQTASFHGHDTALKIALAAASAGALDALLFAQGRIYPTSLDESAVPRDAVNPETPESRSLEQTLSAVDSMRSVLIGYAVHAPLKENFAAGLLERECNKLTEALNRQDGGPESFYQSGYRVGALTALSIQQRGPG